MSEAQTKLLAREDRLASRLRRIVLTVAWLLSGLGVLVLLGWAIHSEALKAVLPGGTTMKANTAAEFLLAGLALFLVPPQGRATTLKLRLLGLRAFATALAMPAFLTLVEYASGRSLHLDELLVMDPSPHLYPGRMAPISSINFVLTSVALAGVHGKALSRRISQGAAAALLSLAFAALIGSLYGVPLLYGSYQYQAMALHTGIAFLLLGVALLASDRHTTLMELLSAPEAGGWLVRRMVPAMVLVPMLLGWLFVQPRVNFGRPQLGIAMLAVALAALSTVALLRIGRVQNRMERARQLALMQREAALEQLRQRDRDLRLVTEHLPTLLSYLDVDGRFVRVNQTYESWLGVPATSLIGKTLREMLGDAYWQRTQLTREEARRTGRPMSLETTYPTAGGERQVQVTYAPDVDSGGRLLGYACMVLDIDDRRRAEMALRESEKLAVVGRMASSIAHEINNPLESMTNLLYLATHSTQIDEIREYLALAERELRRAAGITSQTLRFHKQLSSPTEVTCAELLESVLAIYQGKLVNSSIAVERRKGSVRAVQCFEGEIRQVLSNLVGNAIDAMPEGGVLYVRSRCSRQGKTGQAQLSLTVADTGCGMDAATLSKVRQAFFTTKGFNGTGLGLWISQEIVDRHGGSLAIRSTLGRGTVCVLSLPYNAVPRA